MIKWNDDYIEMSNITTTKNKLSIAKDIFQSDYLPTWSVSPRKAALIKAAMAIPTGLNMETNTGPFLSMHQVSTENVTTLPKTACNIVFP